MRMYLSPVTESTDLRVRRSRDTSSVVSKKKTLRGKETFINNDDSNNIRYNSYHFIIDFCKKKKRFVNCKCNEKDYSKRYRMKLNNLSGSQSATDPSEHTGLQRTVT